MKNFFSIFLWLFFFSLSAFANAQGNQLEKFPAKKSTGKWELTYGMGVSFLGSAKDIKAQMIASGLDYNDYPTTNHKAIYTWAIKYNFNERHGIQANFGLNDAHEISGTSGPPNTSSPYLIIKSKAQAFTACYVLNSENGRHSFKLGPALIMHRIEQNQNSYEKVNNLKPGVDLGYSFKLINGNNLFLNFESDYIWARKVEIGPYEKSFFSWLGIPDPHEIIFESTKADLSTLAFKLSLGVKLGRLNKV